MKGHKNYVIDVLFTLALFCVFAAASLIVVFIGADVYRAAIDRADASFEVNTGLSYVATKIRKHDTAGAVRLDELEGVHALVLEQPIGDNIFETWIYHYDGMVRELFINSDNSDLLRLQAGQGLIPVYSFEIQMLEMGLLEISAVSQGGPEGRMLVALRSLGVGE